MSEQITRRAALFPMCMKIDQTLLLTVVACVFLVACNGSDTASPSTHSALENSSDIAEPTASGARVAPGPTDVTQVATGSSDIVSDSTRVPGITDQWPQARYATAGTIVQHEQRPGDVVAGRSALLDNPYVSCGIPERVYRQLLPDTGVVSAKGRAPAADGLPYAATVFTNDDGVRIVSNNCLTCHGTSLFGELVIGLGNEFLDFTTDASQAVERAGALVQGDAETRAWELYADRINAIAPYSQPHTIGVNPANNLTAALIAHRNATDNAWSDEPLLPLPPTDVPPVSVPPWWRMAKKPAMFNLGEGRLDHARIMMSASMLCSDTLEELEAIDEYAPDIRAYIASLTPPPYPFPVDQVLADSGREVFGNNCSHCHGTYEGDITYPGRVVPLDVVQTDSTLVDFAHGPGAAYIDWFNRSYYGELSTAAPGPGYVAPPLDGIWATAPFLHNGAVPTIAMVLDSRERPTYWQHEVTDASDPESYDQARLGWSHTELPRGKSGIDDVRVYDTTLPGYSNSGHLFADHLTEAERTAVIEYLKTL